jgi:hypothetical protein
MWSDGHKDVSYGSTYKLDLIPSIEFHSERLGAIEALAVFNKIAKSGDANLSDSYARAPKISNAVWD